VPAQQLAQYPMKTRWKHLMQVALGPPSMPVQNTTSFFTLNTLATGYWRLTRLFNIGCHENLVDLLPKM